ncbi:MAG: Hsp20/alpha crystallin family protein [Chloroflexota bacterium]|nr:Hsp20/alpha crystallin family protein [Chloroflexota bacterium]
MDKLFDESLIPPAFLTMEHRTFPVDLYETAETYTLKASLPGMDPLKIGVEAMSDAVTVKGELVEEKEEKKGAVVRQERRYGRFERTIGLPVAIDPAKVEATYEHGVLTLVMPKSQVVRPKSIEVKVR